MVSLRSSVIKLGNTVSLKVDDGLEVLLAYSYLAIGSMEFLGSARMKHVARAPEWDEQLRRMVRCSPLNNTTLATTMAWRPTICGYRESFVRAVSCHESWQFFLYGLLEIEEDRQPCLWLAESAFLQCKSAVDTPQLHLMHSAHVRSPAAVQAMGLDLH